MVKLRGKLYPLAPWAAGVLIALVGTPAWAVDLKTADGAWTFSIDGNVNVDYIYSNCESSTTPAVAGGLACLGSASGSNVSNIGNGLLPAAFTFAVSTTQGGYDLSAHLGLFPGIATNDGGSPNLQQNTVNGASNTALGTTGLDVRQVYMTFGNKDVGTFTFGRNFGLFGFDAIINDMTLPGVGVAGSASSAAPANTTLGSIGLGYIYVDTLAQMDYTTPDFSGLNFTIGIFDPINAAGHGDTVAPKKAPGFHGKAAWTMPINSTTKFYGSVTFIEQKQDYIGAAGPYSWDGTGVDVFAKIDVQDFEAFAYYYHGSGLGTTGLFVLSDDGLGNKRDSDGFLVQATYKVGQVKFGVNYGESKLDYANAADQAANPALVSKNKKVTGGVYDSLTKNLTLLAEISDVHADAHNGVSNHSTNFNIGAFLSF
jgi:predicted porin